MEDLISLLIFGAVILFSMLGSRKKRAQGQRPPVRRPAQAAARPSPRPVRERVQPATRPETPQSPDRQRTEPGGEPQELVEGLLDLLRGRIPIEVPTPKAEPEVEVDDEARSLETEPDRAREHREFHDRYVEPSVPATVTPQPRSRYRLTPKTAREAVVWTAIFTKPKGLE
jgi:hypothetical protein